MHPSSPAASPSVSRRRFIGQTSLGAAAVATASVSSLFSTSGCGRAEAPTATASTSSASPSSAASPDPSAASAAPRKLGVALVGLGGYATHLLAPALQQTRHCALRGVVTGSREKGLRWARQFGFPEQSVYGYDTMAQLAGNPDIDVVYVVTPNALHAEHTIAAARAGKHVICEKPMAVTVAECDAMLAACRAAGVQLFIGYRLQFEPHFDELKRLAREQDFGPLQRMTGAVAFTMTQPQWRAEKKLAGGGPLMDLGIYAVQAACMAAGEIAPIAVTAKERPKERPEFFRDVEETLDWTMEFASGARAQFVTSYNAGADTFRAEGARGWIEFTPAFAYGGLKTTTHRGPLEIAAPPSQQAVQLDAMALCLREGRAAPASGAMGRRDMVILEAIYEAARTGGRVEVKT